MIDCTPDTTGKVCVNCGWTWSRDRPFPRRNCPQSPDLHPAADRLGVPFATIGRYAQALAAWIAAGIPERTPEEQAACMAACHGCEYGTPKPQCRAGGCASVDHRPDLVSCWKIATWHCPEKKWPTTAQPQKNDQ